MYTTLLTGSSHDLQLISRVPPCSMKHLDTSCSLQHIDRSTICSGHVPPRTDDSYQLQSYVVPRLSTCPAVLEATRKLNYYSHQILQAWSVQFVKKHAPHRSITSIDNTTCSSIDFCQPPSTQTLVPSTDNSLTTIDRRHSSTVDRHLPSDIDRYFSPNIDRY
ncbi:hypothetical protein DY000_02021768 [Brassica cretica]|uniref:Uncharacterized protein n=1 Tax=Brassica cretica TaxID=69181 RepID=A0ABQ7EKT8_BRACR|nr:hypothetical protein DY000_02021768 [Brassica cretica]